MRGHTRHAEKSVMAINLDLLKIKRGEGPKCGIDKKFFYLEDGFYPSELDDCVIIHKDVYKQIFGKTRKTSSNEKKLLSVVKISYNDRSIHRAFKTNYAITKKKIALTYNSLRLLSEAPDEVENVEISKGCRFAYFWYHPFHATRISMRIGVISVIIGLVGVILSIISLCPEQCCQ